MIKQPAAELARLIWASEVKLFVLRTGEKLTKEETKALMKELCDPADDDGFMPFKRKSFNHIWHARRR